MKNWFTQMIKSLSEPILPSSDTKGKNVTAILQMERCYKHYWSNKDSQFSSKIRDRTIQSMCEEIRKQLLPWYQSQLSLITIAEIIASFTIIVWFGDQQIQPTANLLMAIHMEFLRQKKPTLTLKHIELQILCASKNNLAYFSRKH